MSLPIPRDRTRFSQTELILPLLAIAILFASKLVYDKLRRGISVDYTVVRLALNYFQFGAVRRGLLGSVIYASHINLLYASMIVHAVSTATLLILSFFILRLMKVIWIEYLVFLIVLTVLLWCWASDIGRIDIVVVVVLLATALSLVNGHILLASSFVASGAFIHEEAAIYGLPLLAAILIDSGRYQKFSFKSLLASCAILAGGAIIYVAIMLLPHSSNKVIVATLAEEYPSITWDNYYNTKAFYYELGGFETIKTALCTVNNSRRLIQPFISLIIIALTIFALSDSRRRIEWTLPIIASMPSVLFLWMTATDMSRWTVLGVLNVWIVCAVRNRAVIEDGGTWVDDRRWAWAKVMCAVALLPILHQFTRYDSDSRLYYASPYLERAIYKILPVRQMEECDPNWRSVLSQN